MILCRCRKKSEPIIKPADDPIAMYETPTGNVYDKLPAHFYDESSTDNVYDKIAPNFLQQSENTYARLKISKPYLPPSTGLIYELRDEQQNQNEPMETYEELPDSYV